MESPVPPITSLESAEDAELLTLVAARRQDALAELYDRYAGMLLALSQRVVGTAEHAEEVLQEVLLYVWNQPRRYDPGRSSVSTWLVLLVRSRSIDRLRKRKVRQRAVDQVRQEKKDSPHTSHPGIRRVLGMERRRRVGEELAKIPAEQRQVLEMAFFQGMTQREIAAATGIPLGTVKTRSLLAMRKLRTALADEIEELL